MHKCGEREEEMKTKTYYFILVITAWFVSTLVPCRAGQSPSGEKPLSMNQSHPAFIGIDSLHTVILKYGNSSDTDMPFYKQIEEDVKDKLRLADIKLATPTAENVLSIPELRIYISTINLEESQQCVFQIRTALARAVCLKNRSNPTFKSDIWQTTPVMQVVSSENIPDKLTEMVLEQVEGFINIYEDTKSINKINVNINETDSSVDPEKQIDATEEKYVASKSSAIFHKPDCRWAGNISQTTLVIYNSKEEAIKAGKRPCKTCNP